MTESHMIIAMSVSNRSEERDGDVQLSSVGWTQSVFFSIFSISMNCIVILKWKKFSISTFNMFLCFKLIHKILTQTCKMFDL